MVQVDPGAKFGGGGVPNFLFLGFPFTGAAASPSSWGLEVRWEQSGAGAAAATLTSPDLSAAFVPWLLDSGSPRELRRWCQQQWSRQLQPHPTQLSQPGDCLQL